MRRSLDRIKADNAWTLEQQQSICEIPAPPFKESVRGAEYKRRLEALGLTVPSGLLAIADEVIE